MQVFQNRIAYNYFNVHPQYDLFVVFSVGRFNGSG